MGSFKARRKQSKYKQILRNELNIDVTEEPAKNLMIGNAGLVSGVQYEQLAKLFTLYGSVEKVVMIPRKPYSFVVFSTVNEAAKAFEAVNGQVKLDNMDGPMYLVYCASVPTEFDYPTSDRLPDGLTLLTDFVTGEEEEQLLNCVNWDTSSQETGKTLKHRRVKHYGYEFRYDNNNVDKDRPLSESLPEQCSVVVSRLRELGRDLPWTPNQLTVNQYQKGQGIPSHIDTHSAFESPLLSLSLSSDVVMEFRRGSQHIPVLLPRRSLLIMDGEARYAWTHGITPRTMDVVTVTEGLSVRDRACRTSFTLRRVRDGLCRCSFPSHCDSQQPPPQPIPDHEAGRLEDLYVHQVYSNIASHFSETRTKIWPNVQEFLQSFAHGSVLIDAGCGNGKYFGVNTNVFQVGFDRSVGLAEITHGRGHQVFVCDCLSLPLRDAVADGLISVAVLHHLSTRERRLQALREVSRVLTAGGRALVTVWAKDQTKQDQTAYLKQDRKNRRKGNKDRNEPRGAFAESEESNVTSTNPSNTSDKGSTECITKDPKSKEDIKNSLSLPSSDFKLPVHTARTEFQHQDIFVPWKVKSKDPSQSVKEVFLRYYHVFEENELFQLCSTLTNIIILQTYYTEGNWCIVLEKV